MTVKQSVLILYFLFQHFYITIALSGYLGNGGNNLNYKKFLAVGSVALFGVGLFGFANGVNAASTDEATISKKTDTTKKAAQTVTSYQLMTKVAGSKNYTVWKNVRNGKVSTKVADAINFRYNHIQSNQSIKTSKYTYWLIYVDGRRVGWVNQRYFARNKISVPKTVSLVNNPNYSFNTRDAISYATDSTGTVVDNTEVTVSKDTIDCGTAGTTKVTYSYGSGSATSTVTVRKTTSEGIADADKVTAKTGTNKLPSWVSHYGASLNYLSPTDFTAETKTHSLTSDDMTLTTRLYQPVFLSVKTDTTRDGNINRVGHIPEGVTVSDGWAYTSLLSHINLTSGHVVGYNLNKLVNPYNPQYLLTMSQSKFNTYVKNIKVSPYVPIGHGQSMGSSSKYVYLLANDNTKVGSAASEEIIQLNKTDLTIHKIWTIKCWNGSSASPRYFKNAVIVNDYLMYGLYYDPTKDRYEYWRFDRTGDNWNPTIVGATSSTFVGNNEPVQGFTYDSTNNNFYIAFNDLIVRLGTDGTIKKSYTFTTGREIEGISVSDNKLYANLAQRAELLESNSLK
ncbi:hypothetical protein LA664_04395 [Lactobacillus amylolyticus]|uniref:Bacterial group 3 Ig-like protein n=1 Tax=Lactobacillus amylolyticus DSM 11664 TaxID=585524 RepID=D4YT32_9LACO|nr:bacterial group 3 Ig-like protein [Lactobacillus amylolyticus DSM 11664]QFY04512.1 hypothetical protein LA664_04395 [Lactobacillus amylolyticus]